MQKQRNDASEHQQFNKQRAPVEKFFKYDNQCLRFNAYWDNRSSPKGYIHDLIIFYYLRDDAIQINEINEGVSSILYKRQKLPKVNIEIIRYFLEIEFADLHFFHRI